MIPKDELRISALIAAGIIIFAGVVAIRVRGGADRGIYPPSKAAVDDAPYSREIFAGGCHWSYKDEGLVKECPK
jgi:hypothetical protein